ncbi:MAG: polysaccharide biosynthesis protein [Sulfitobacter sp.]|nr:polysaccharide biosynthesis protein [Sulfitobacter sp.]
MKAQNSELLTANGAACYADRTVMVTGAGGSIGLALCHRLLACGPRRIVLFEISEYALYEAERALLAAADRVEIIAVLGSVTEPRLVRRTLAHWGVEIILHGAAYKHVPMVEVNPMVGIVNNVLGTQRLAEQALQARVDRFVLLSTDKAVRPVSVMGASKRLAELVVQDLARRGGGTRFATVRFGNVWGSSGSVVPLFREQIAQGGPVTVTHPSAERYFISSDAATALVLEAGALAEGGETFLPDMGAPMRIMDLAREMIAELAPRGDVPIVVSGLRPGEKLQEDLSLTATRTPTAHPELSLACEPGLTAQETAVALRQLREAFVADSDDMVRAVIARWVEARAEPDTEAVRLTS